MYESDREEKLLLYLLRLVTGDLQIKLTINRSAREKTEFITYTQKFIEKWLKGVARIWGFRAPTEKQMTFGNGKWAIRRTDRRCDGFVTMSVWCGMETSNLWWWVNILWELLGRGFTTNEFFWEALLLDNKKSQVLKWFLLKIIVISQWYILDSFKKKKGPWWYKARAATSHSPCLFAEKSQILSLLPPVEVFGLFLPPFQVLPGESYFSRTQGWLCKKVTFTAAREGLWSLMSYHGVYLRSSSLKPFSHLSKGWKALNHPAT